MISGLLRKALEKNPPTPPFAHVQNYIVHGIIRRSSSFNTARIAHLFDDPKIHSQKRMILRGGAVDFSKPTSSCTLEWGSEG